MPIDYAKLAAQHGGRPVAAPAIDYAALAQEHGGTPVAPPAGQPVSDGRVDVLGALLSPLGKETAETVRDVGTGAIKAGMETVSWLGDRARDYIPGVDKLDTIVGPAKADLTRTTPAEKVGGALERVVETAAPGGLVKRGATALTARAAPALTRVVGKTAAAVLPRAAVEGTASAAIAAAQGGDPLTAGVVGALVPGAGAALSGRTATALREGAEKRVVQALGPTKERFKAMAERLAPEVLKRGLGGSREAILARAADAAEQAGERIDDAIVRFGAREVDTQPVLDALETAKDAFRTKRTIPIAQAAREGLLQKPGVRAIGQEVEIPVVFDQRPIVQLENLKQIVEDLGPNARVDQLVAVRRAWDKVVDQAGGFAHRAGGAIGMPLRDQSEAWAKREATSAIRQLLNTEVPELGALNKEFSFWKGLEDVVEQTVKRTQPQGPGLGRQVAEVAGAAAGSSSGVGTAFALGKVARFADSVFRSPRWRLADARMRNALADAIVNNKLGEVTSALGRIAAVQGSQVPAMVGAR